MKYLSRIALVVFVCFLCMSGLVFASDSSDLTPEEYYVQGLRYETGDGVKQTYQVASVSYKLAAKQGHAGAQTRLGSLYLHGLGVPQDYGEAVKWLGKAADHQDPLALYLLGLCYYNGHGVARNYLLARDLFVKSQKNGFSDATKMIKRIDNINAGFNPLDQNLHASEAFKKGESIRSTFIGDAQGQMSDSKTVCLENFLKSRVVRCSISNQDKVICDGHGMLISKAGDCESAIKFGECGLDPLHYDCDGSVYYCDMKTNLYDGNIKKLASQVCR